MTKKLEIVPARRDDVEAIHAIEEVCFPSPWRSQFFESEIAAEGRFNLVVKRNGVVIGYLFAMWLFDELHVNKIAVIEEERRQGIADQLMERCVAFARAHEVKTISLEVRKSNTGAQEFYKHLEFKPSYIRQKYYPDGEAAVVMTRAL